MQEATNTVQEFKAIPSKKDSLYSEFSCAFKDKG